MPSTLDMARGNRTMAKPESGLVSVDRVELLRFFDDPRSDEQGMHATAVNAVAGEELGLALLMQYFADSGIKATVLDGPCSTGKMRGHRLDAWVHTPDVLYSGLRPSRLFSSSLPSMAMRPERTK